MQELIDVIRVSIATDATTEQKAAGVQACRTIATALDTEPGKPLTIPSMTSAPRGARISVDQMLDLVIARLTMIATEREREPAAVPPADAPVATRSLPAPQGFRVPVAPTTALAVQRRAVDPRRGQAKPAMRAAATRRSAPRKP